MDYRIIIRYLNNEATTQEVDKLKLWLEANVNNQRVFEEVKFFWNTSAKFSDVNDADQRFNAREDWNFLLDKIEIEVEARASNKKREDKKLRKPTTRRYTRSSEKSNLTQIVRIAAVLLISACMGIFVWQYAGMTPPKEEISFREMVIEKGQRANVVLSDGTHMTLNADTKLRFPETFPKNLREIFLIRGEAYFEVAENPEKPFLIHTNDTVVRVLGTKFAVRSYPEDKAVRIVVKDGAVRFSSNTVLNKENESGGDSVILGSEQIGRFDIGNKYLTTKPAEDLDLYLSWTKGHLKFRETPLDAVALQLERKYNIEVEFESPDLKALQLTGELKSRKIQNVLAVIKASLNLDYREVDQQKIVFMKSRTDS